MRIVNLTVKIPEGPNCRNCPAKKEKWQGATCQLYGAALSGHGRFISERDGWKKRKQVMVWHKCEACRNCSTDYAINQDGGGSK